MEVLKIAFSNLNQIAKHAEIQLKIVEGDSALADLQGFLLGAENLRANAIEAGILECFDFVEIDKAETTLIDEMKVSEISTYCDEIETLKASAGWESFQNIRREQIEEKKEFLFNKAKKGRDLVYIQGWKKAVYFIDKYFNEIKSRYEAEQQAGLPLFE